MAVILLVDDDQQLLTVLSRDLRRKGHDTRAATTLDAGLSLLAQQRPDAVLIGLPVRETEELVRAVGLAEACIVTTPTPTREDQARIAELRCQILAKPFTPNELVAVLERATGGGRLASHSTLLIDTLLAHHRKRVSLCLTIRTPLEGVIVIRHGELVHATHGQHTGFAALVELLRARGIPEAEPYQDPAVRTLDGGFHALIFSALAEIEQDERLRQRLEGNR